MNTFSELICQVDAHRVPDTMRRDLLLAQTGVPGVAGLVAASVPFITSLAASEAARRAVGLRIPLIADTRSKLIADSVPDDRGHSGRGA